MDLKNIAKQIRIATIKMTVSNIVSVLNNTMCMKDFKGGA
jgi:hypothetical protein